MATMILYPYVRYPKGIAVAFLISISGRYFAIKNGFYGLQREELMDEMKLKIVDSK